MTFFQIRHKPAYYIVTFFPYLSQISSHFVTFYKIHHG
jgi:hypothetical protein